MCANPLAGGINWSICSTCRPSCIADETATDRTHRHWLVVESTVDPRRPGLANGPLVRAGRLSVRFSPPPLNGKPLP